MRKSARKALRADFRRMPPRNDVYRTTGMPLDRISSSMDVSSFVIALAQLLAWSRELPIVNVEPDSVLARVHDRKPYRGDFQSSSRRRRASSAPIDGDVGVRRQPTRNASAGDSPVNQMSLENADRLTRVQAFGRVALAWEWGLKKSRNSAGEHGMVKEALTNLCYGKMRHDPHHAAG